MIDREPVDIMGVTAFPNPNQDERVIRFIDSEYHTLFTIKDGESIVITRFDGEKVVLPCKYIDDCHVCVGNSAYHNWHGRSMRLSVRPTAVMCSQAKFPVPSRRRRSAWKTKAFTTMTAAARRRWRMKI